MLNITPQGVLLHDRFLNMGAESMEPLRETFDDSELRELREGLERLVGGLGLERTVRPRSL